MRVPDSHLVPVRGKCTPHDEHRTIDFLERNKKKFDGDIYFIFSKIRQLFGRTDVVPELVGA